MKGLAKFVLSVAVLGFLFVGTAFADPPGEAEVVAAAAVVTSARADVAAAGSAPELAVAREALYQAEFGYGRTCANAAKAFRVNPALGFQVSVVDLNTYVNQTETFHANAAQNSGRRFHIGRIKDYALSWLDEEDEDLSALLMAYCDGRPTAAERGFAYSEMWWSYTVRKQQVVILQKIEQNAWTALSLQRLSPSVLRALVIRQVQEEDKARLTAILNALRRLPTDDLEIPTSWRRNTRFGEKLMEGLKRADAVDWLADDPAMLTKILRTMNVMWFKMDQTADFADDYKAFVLDVADLVRSTQ